MRKVLDITFLQMGQFLGNFFSQSVHAITWPQGFKATFKTLSKHFISSGFQIIRKEGWNPEHAI